MLDRYLKRNTYILLWVPCSKVPNSHVTMFLLNGLIAPLSSVLFAHLKRARDRMHYPVPPENRRDSQRGPLSDLYLCGEQVSKFHIW
jgi:hypothetical protein